MTGNDKNTKNLRVRDGRNSGLSSTADLVALCVVGVLLQMGVHLEAFL